MGMFRRIKNMTNPAIKIYPNFPEKLKYFR